MYHVGIAVGMAGHAWAPEVWRLGCLGMGQGSQANSALLSGEQCSGLNVGVWSLRWQPARRRYGTSIPPLRVSPCWHATRVPGQEAYQSLAWSSSGLHDCNQGAVHCRGSDARRVMTSQRC